MAFVVVVDLARKSYLYTLKKILYDDLRGSSFLYIFDFLQLSSQKIFSCNGKNIKCFFKDE